VLVPLVTTAVRAAAEVFLSRRLYRRLSDGSVIHPGFLKPAYPRYWHYDLLFGLVVMKEGGFLADPRCADALAELQGTRLPDGGWACPTRHYRYRDSAAPGGLAGHSNVPWGPHGKTRMNPWVTLDALEVVGASGTGS
jgi:hypothetical protein